MGTVGFVNSAGLPLQRAGRASRTCHEAATPKPAASSRARRAVVCVGSGDPGGPDDIPEGRAKLGDGPFQSFKKWVGSVAQGRTQSEAEELLTAAEHQMVQELKQKLTVTADGRLEAMFMLREAKMGAEKLKDELADAERSIKDLQAKQKAAQQAKELTNRAQRDMEERQSRTIAIMQEKLDNSARMLNKEIIARKEQQRRVNELEAEKTVSDTKLRNLAASSLELEVALSSKSEELSNYREDGTELDALLSEKKELQSRLAGLEHLVRDREREISTLLKRQNEAETQISQTKDAVAQARANLEQECRKTAALSSELSSSVKESDLAAVIVNDLAKRLDDRTAQLESAKEEISFLTAKLRDGQLSAYSSSGPPSSDSSLTKRDMERIEDELASLKQKYSQLEAKLRASGREVQALQRSERLKDTQLERARMQLAAAEESNKAFRRQLAEAGAKVEQMEGAPSNFSDIPALNDKGASTDAYLAQLTRA